MDPQIAPHGGKLINRFVSAKESEELKKKAASIKKTLTLHAREISDLEMIACGAFSPLEGFLTKKDYESVVLKKRLASGLPWTIPITLSASKDEVKGFSPKDEVVLKDEKGSSLAILHLEEVYHYDKEIEATNVFKTTETKHPGVDYLYNRMGDALLGGRVSVFHLQAHTELADRRLTPEKTREFFKTKGWKRIVAFQTRNPIHRAHEYIIKCALEMVDGLLIHPIVGETKAGDIPANIRFQCYEALVSNYFPKDRVLLSALGAAMRYAGPREAIFHALVRKNYGCTHFIVGRDHAGVGNYYGTFDAQKIFDEFTPDEIGIMPLRFDHTFFCKACEEMASVKTCPHDASHHVQLSGTQVRQMLVEGKLPPAEFSRPEVAQILIRETQKAGQTA